MVNDNDPGSTPRPSPTLPARARVSLNRCNVPTVILGSLTYQRHPALLTIDGVKELHAGLFRMLATMEDARQRASHFIDYVTVHFRLHHPEDAGLEENARRDRSRLDYRRLILGWAFNPDGQEAAVLKGWVESRFGLLPRYHGEPIRKASDPACLAYQEARATGLYNTNALESQLDLLFTFCQFERLQRYPDRQHIRLYRGVNRLDEHEVLAREGRRWTVVLNNLSSFTENRERAEEFGDHLLEAEVPLAKIFFYNHLLPGLLSGENEYAVIGGVYQIQLIY